MLEIGSLVATYCIGIPAKERPLFSAKLAGQQIHHVAADRPLSDYASRIQAAPSSIVVCWDKPTPEAIETCAKFGFTAFRAWRSGNDGTADDYTLEPIDLATAALALSREGASSEPPDQVPPTVDGENLSGLLFYSDEASAEKPAAMPRPASKPITLDDITVVFSVRVTDGNLWLIDRLRLFGDYYAPQVRVIVVDFGSELTHSESIEQLCETYGYQYKFIDDRDVFCLSKARNVGVELATTEFVFLSDPDFFFPRDVFSRLVHLANVADMGRYIDVVLMCAAYHLTARATKDLVELRNHDAMSARLEHIGFTTTYDGFGKNVEFIAPYANVFLINKKYFSLAGGYDTTFRGHGSEDFEFFIRLTRYSRFLPMPASVEVDTGGPMSKEFFGPKKLEGFRVLNSLVAVPAVLSGLKAFHLYHPAGRNTSWKTNNDWKRNKLQAALQPLAKGMQNLLAIDHLTRSKKVICICVQAEHWGYFVPLRALGYELVPIFSETVASLEEATRMIVDGEAAALAIFNPYMTSHAKFRSLFFLAKEKCKTIAIERGALPGTVYYSSDVAYCDPSFSDEAFAEFEPTPRELEDAVAYGKVLRTGVSTLEKNLSYEFTMRSYAPLRENSRPICFIPLQLEYDMAVTKFQRDAQQYVDFAASIDAVARKNPEIVFVVKPHPLSKSPVELSAANVIVAGDQDNFHALIDLASHTICYNSGVGLISIIHGKPTYTIGNAYYNRGGTGMFCDSLDAAVAQHKRAPHRPDPRTVAKLVAWLRMHRYSFFSATDDVRDFGERKSHGYKDVTVTRLVLDGQALELDRLGSDYPFSWQSFGVGNLGLSPQPQAAQKPPANSVAKPAAQAWPMDLKPQLQLSEKCTRRSDGSIEIGSGSEGHAIYGPYLKLSSGEYRASVSFEFLGSTAPFFARRGEVIIEIAGNGGQSVFAERRLRPTDLKAGLARHELDFALPAGGSPIQIECRIWTDGKTKLLVREAILASRQS